MGFQILQTQIAGKTFGLIFLVALTTQTLYKNSVGATMCTIQKNEAHVKRDI